MSNFAQIAYKGVNLSVEVEPPPLPSVPQDLQLYLNSGDFVPYFKFSLLPVGEADIYETESWLSRATGNIWRQETDDDIFDVEGGVRKGYRVHAVSGTPLGVFQNPDTLNVRIRAKSGDLYSDWSQTLQVIYQY
jgi:hypothetical protein